MRTLYCADQLPPEAVFSDGLNERPHEADEHKEDSPDSFSSNSPEAACTTEIPLAAYFPMPTDPADVKALSTSYLYICQLDGDVIGFRDQYRQSLTLFAASSPPSAEDMCHMVMEWPKIRKFTHLPPANIQAAIKVKRHFNWKELRYDSFDVIDVIANPSTKYPLTDAQKARWIDTIKLNKAHHDSRTLLTLQKINKVLAVGKKHGITLRVELTDQEKKGIALCLKSFEQVIGFDQGISSYNDNPTRIAEDLPTFDELAIIAERERDRCLGDYKRTHSIRLWMQDPETSGTPEDEQPYVQTLKHFLATRAEPSDGIWADTEKQNELYLNHLKAQIRPS